MTSDNDTIDLNNLSYGLPGLTSQMGGALAQAAAVCLEDQEHTVGVSLSVSGVFTKSFAVHWPEVSDQTRRCYNDPEEATEWGACGVAILLVLALTDYTVVERSRKGTGFDYWLGHEDDDLPFQHKARLEISGIRNGNNSAIDRRVKQKLLQTVPTDGPLPALIVVVEFGNPLSKVRQK